MIRASWPTLTQNLLVLDSREAILDLAPLLESLAERCGQAGAMHWLPYFLDPNVMGRRIPILVLLLRPEEIEGRSLCVDDVNSAVLFFEYQVLGVRTGAVAHARNTTGDAIGSSSVIAPRGERTRVAATAARALIERGASIVLATYEGAEDSEGGTILSGRPGVFSATRRRRIAHSLRLMPTLDATLATLGKSTRFNLRYYRRRLEKQMRCEYIDDASQALSMDDLQALNAGSLNPVAAEEFMRRVRSASELPGSFLSGLRGLDGRWLSLVGGWRQGSTTVLFWQMNTAGFEKHSISTVMRCFLLEKEIARGAQRLLIHGGTPHTMRHAFEQETVADLILRRRNLQGTLLFWASRLLLRPSGLGLRPNFLTSALQDPSLHWESCPASVAPKTRASIKPRTVIKAA